MKLESQVCSLELARNLKELGVRQESLFAWYQKGSYFSGDKHYEAEAPYVDNNYGEPNDFPQKLLCAAFTVAELGEMLPWEIGVHFDKWNDQWLYYYGDMDDKPYSNTEADARAKCLVYLIEQGIVKP